jgi:hypothetical protein
MEQVEFRLYYDDMGNILHYSCEKTEGNYIVIDAQTYAEGRYDVRVEDGEIVQAIATTTIHKLIQSDSGTRCAVEDVSIVVPEEYVGETNYWNITNV